MNLPIIGEPTAPAPKPQIVIPGSDPAGAVPLNEHGQEKFARKPTANVPLTPLQEIHVQIPPLWYWEDVEGGVSNKMTMAFKFHGLTFGMSYPIASDEATNAVKVGIIRKKLFAVVKESMDVLVHHGKKVLDSHGNIDPRLVNDEEAIRFRYDKDWDKKVAAFNKLVKIAPITRKKAKKLGLIT